MYLDRASNSTRIRAAVPVVAVHALLALVLLRGLQSFPVPDEPEPLQLVDLPAAVEPPHEEPPPPPASGEAAPELRPADPRSEGAASPPDLIAEPTPVVAPDPVIPAPRPPQTVNAAPIAGIGTAPSAGAAPVRGPGTGSGGIGAGRGSGQGGAGGGGGDGGAGTGPVGRLSPPRQVRGELSIGDMPDSLRNSGFRGRVWVLYRVETDGRVTQCRVTRSSGSRAMDLTTCRLIEQRFRFRPARDSTGRPFWSQIEEFHEWEADEEPPERRRRRDDW